MLFGHRKSYERYRVKRSASGVTETPPGSNGPTWAIGEREDNPHRGAPPHGMSEQDKGRGRNPLFPLLLPSFPSSSTWNPTRTWSPSRTPFSWRALQGPAGLPSPPL